MHKEKESFLQFTWKVFKAQILIAVLFYSAFLAMSFLYVIASKIYHFII